jgi:hypothetical protein
MNEKTRRVFNGWLNLTPDERREFQDAIRQYNDATEPRRTEIRESIRKRASDARMETGPLGGGVCACCGRG